MSSELVLVETHGSIALITLNRPEKLNALNEALRQTLMTVVDELAAHDGVRVAVLRGAGDKAFAAGADVTEFAGRTPAEQRQVYGKRRVYDAVGLSGGERDFLERHIARLAGLTNLTFRSSDSWADSNFIVYFVSEARYASAIARYLAPERMHLLARLSETSCLGLSRSHRVTHALEHAIAIIPVERGIGGLRVAGSLWSVSGPPRRPPGLRDPRSADVHHAKRHDRTRRAAGRGR